MPVSQTDLIAMLTHGTTPLARNVSPPASSSARQFERESGKQSGRAAPLGRNSAAGSDQRARGAISAAAKRLRRRAAFVALALPPAASFCGAEAARRRMERGKGRTGREIDGATPRPGPRNPGGASSFGAGRAHRLAIAAGYERDAGYF